MRANIPKEKNLKVLIYKVELLIYSIEPILSRIFDIRQE